MEINSINPAQNAVGDNSEKKEKLKELCTQFESFFYNMIMKAGRDASFDSGLVEKSRGEKVFTDMMDQKISEMAADRSKGGMKEMLFDYLEKGLGESSEEGKKFQAGSSMSKEVGNIYSEKGNLSSNKFGIDIAL